MGSSTPRATKQKIGPKKIPRIEPISDASLYPEILKIIKNINIIIDSKKYFIFFIIFVLES